MNSYKIVCSDKDPNGFEHEIILNLENKVKSLLGEGWTCLGGVVIYFSDVGSINRLCQTMVKLQV